MVPTSVEELACKEPLGEGGDEADLDEQTPHCFGSGKHREAGVRFSAIGVRGG
jgi:hypothetical protein